MANLAWDCWGKMVVQGVMHVEGSMMEVCISERWITTLCYIQKACSYKKKFKGSFIS